MSWPVETAPTGWPRRGVSLRLFESSLSGEQKIPGPLVAVGAGPLADVGIARIRPTNQGRSLKRSGISGECRRRARNLPPRSDGPSALPLSPSGESWPRPTGCLFPTATSAAPDVPGVR